MPCDQLSIIAPGHVFLEVWDGERWHLLDPEAQKLYEQYDRVRFHI